MIGEKTHLKMVCTNAIETGGERYPHKIKPIEERERPADQKDLPPIRYNLELVQKPDGTLEWVEGG